MSDGLITYKVMLQGWIPQAIIDMALSGVQLDFIDRVRTRAAAMSNQADKVN